MITYYLSSKTPRMLSNDAQSWDIHLYVRPYRPSSPYGHTPV